MNDCVNDKLVYVDWLRTENNKYDKDIICLLYTSDAADE